MLSADKLDGYLARSRNEVTTQLASFRSIADKLAVVVALCASRVAMVSLGVLLVIVAREFWYRALGWLLLQKGVVVAASDLGKVEDRNNYGSVYSSCQYSWWNDSGCLLFIFNASMWVCSSSNGLVRN